MNTLIEINKIQELFNSNRVFLSSLIGYCKHDIDKTDEITNILSALRIILKQQDEIQKLMEKFVSSRLN